MATGAEIDNLFASGPRTRSEQVADSAPGPSRQWVRRLERCDRCNEPTLATISYVDRSGKQAQMVWLCFWCYPEGDQDGDTTGEVNSTPEEV